MGATCPALSGEVTDTNTGVGGFARLFLRLQGSANGSNPATSLVQGLVYRQTLGPSGPMRVCLGLLLKLLGQSYFLFEETVQLVR